MEKLPRVQDSFVVRIQEVAAAIVVIWFDVGLRLETKKLEAWITEFFDLVDLLLVDQNLFVSDWEISSRASADKFTNQYHSYPIWLSYKTFPVSLQMYLTVL